MLERGKAVPERQRDVESFWRGGRLQTDSNVQFGEGGAGTFSDGKLMTGIKKDMYTAEVFRELTAAGAPEEILYLAKPHLGTDRLAQIVQNIRAEIVSLGGEYRFQNRLEDLLADDDGLKAVKIRDAGGSVYEEPVSALVLAIGHSARDTFEMLQALCPRPGKCQLCAVGRRRAGKFRQRSSVKRNVLAAAAGGKCFPGRRQHLCGTGAKGGGSA